MQINWYGTSCFKIIDQEVSVLTDPLSPEKSGLKNPRITSDIIILSSPEDGKNISSDAFVFKTAGEAEIKEVFIQGVVHFDKKIFKPLYKITVEDLRICFLGELNEELSEEELDKLGEVDVLLVPFNNKILDFKKTKEIINALEPSLIIPSCWKNQKELFGFVKEIGLKIKEETDKLRIKKKDLSTEKTELIVLKPGI